MICFYPMLSTKTVSERYELTKFKVRLLQRPNNKFFASLFLHLPISQLRLVLFPQDPNNLERVEKNIFIKSILYPTREYSQKSAKDFLLN